MNDTQWQALEQARQTLQLGERASLSEIKQAYHRLCKLYHPDIADAQQASRQMMYALTAAYELLSNYCSEYRFPLTRSEGREVVDLYDPEEWWRDRFGEDVWLGLVRAP